MRISLGINPTTMMVRVNISFINSFPGFSSICAHRSSAVDPLFATFRAFLGPTDPLRSRFGPNPFSCISPISWLRKSSSPIRVNLCHPWSESCHIFHLLALISVLAISGCIGPRRQAAEPSPPATRPVPSLNSSFKAKSVPELDELQLIALLSLNCTC